jgi:hypothetical protein
MPGTFSAENLVRTQGSPPIVQKGDAVVKEDDISSQRNHRHRQEMRHMQDVLIALFIGLILGWLIEWVIDWRYWRSTVAGLRQENEHLRSRLEALSSPQKQQSSSAGSKGK